MALIGCSECGKQVSEKAATCPNCGNPVASAGIVKVTGASVQTTEETGKKLKLHLLISSTLIVVGFFAFIIPLIANINNPQPAKESGPSGLIFFFSWLIGVPYYFIVKFKIWWHHK